MRKFLLPVVAAAVAAALALPVSAQDMPTPSVEVENQVSFGKVVVKSAYSEGPGFIVIHNEEGPGIGVAPVTQGWNFNVEVDIDESLVTPTLAAMLHVDDGEVGTYEFDGSSGLDNPVAVDGNVVSPSFSIELLHAHDQFVTDGTVTIGHVFSSVPGWVVIHEGSEGRPGPVLGQAQVPAGLSADVAVTIEGDVTAQLFPMLHVDDGAEGTYEFDGSSGLDNPVRVNGQTAVTPIWTVPHVRMGDQLALGGDGMEMMEGATVVAESVLSQGPGFLVIHTEADGRPGPVAGFAAVNDGLNENVEITLDQAAATAVLWPMLHVDDGEVGTYEFDGSSGLDNPVSVNENVVTFPVQAAPSQNLPEAGVSFDGTTIVIPSAVIDAPGWVVIHSSVDGAPNAVLGQAPLRPGLNTNIPVTVDWSLLPEGAAEDQVFPMLHYDTGAAGVYEFDGSSGLDNPVSVGGNVVVAPLTLTMGE